jgi:hypothetical protein
MAFSPAGGIIVIVQLTLACQSTTTVRICVSILTEREKRSLLLFNYSSHLGAHTRVMRIIDDRHDNVVSLFLNLLLLLLYYQQIQLLCRSYRTTIRIRIKAITTFNRQAYDMSMIARIYSNDYYS